MKRVSRTLLLVGGILGCVATVGLAIAAIIFFIFASPAMTEMLTQMYEDGVLTTNIQGATSAEVIKALQAMFLLIGTIFIILAPLSLVGTILSFVTRSKEKPSLGLLIVLMVFTCISGNEVGLAGGITGIIAVSRARKEKVASEQ